MQNIEIQKSGPCKRNYKYEVCDHHHHHPHYDHNLCQGELGDTLLWELLEQLNLQHLVAVGGLEATV